MSFLDPRGGTRARVDDDDARVDDATTRTRVHGRAFERVKPGDNHRRPARTPSMGARDDVRCVRGHRVRRRVRALRGDETAKTGSHGERDSKETQIMDADDQRYHAARDAVGKFRLGVCATRLALEGRRGESDMWNTVGAGVITSALTGMAIPGNVVMRLKGAALGVAVGGLATLPFAYAVEELEKFLPAQRRRRRNPREWRIGN